MKNLFKAAVVDEERVITRDEGFNDDMPIGNPVAAVGVWDDRLLGAPSVSMMVSKPNIGGY